ncbi:MAG: MBL fold metallo-hydrolase [Bacillota bacterium]|nr:MBL fold metallo-hydrolase [Bacillota bacterium]
MFIQLIRHANIILRINNMKIVVDPLLSPKGSMTPVKNVPNQDYNPLVELPIPKESILNCDALMITHLHRDHFDELAATMIPKDTPVFCQPEDESEIKDKGFCNVISIKDAFIWNDISFKRVTGKHGHGITAIEMGPVSGFIISAKNEPTVYIMGDTVWCPTVKNAISQYKPHIAIANCGAAKFAIGKPITMDAKDMLCACKSFPLLKIVAVHMEAWNHCRLSRKELRDFSLEHNIQTQIVIPEDGESLNFDYNNYLNFPTSN